MHVLVCAVYDDTIPSTGTVAAACRDLMHFAQDCDINAIALLSGKVANAANIQKKVREFGSRCKSGDFFVFICVGFCSNFSLADGNGGTISVNELARSFADFIPCETNILMVFDCCVSGGIGDVSAPTWSCHKAVSISACAEQRVGEDTCKDYSFTRSVVSTLRKLHHDMYEGLSVGDVIRMSLDDKSSESVVVRSAPGTCIHCVGWPLIPRPLDRAFRDFTLVTPRVHFIVIALDYKKTSNPLTCTVDGNNVLSLASACGIKDVTSLFDEEATIPNVLDTIAQVGRRCAPADYFVFYYSGHGSQLPDQDGDERDGKDEVYCLVDRSGNCSAQTFLRDDDFARAVSSHVPHGTNILLISDCCHSGSIADFDKPEWAGRQAISLSGCTDSQTATDTGRGGVFTHALLLAIERMSNTQKRQTAYSVGTLFATTLEEDAKVFNSPQNLTMSSIPGTSSGMIWPLVPNMGYKAPWTRGSFGANRSSSVITSPASHEDRAPLTD